MSHNLIASIYEARVIGWAKAKSPPLGVVVENGAYEPKNGEAHLRVYTLPADTASNTLGGDHKLYTGVFQVSIVMPAGKYRGPAGVLADEISSQFPLYERNTKNGLTVVTLTPVGQGPSIQGDTTYTVPLSFQYRSDTTP